MFPDELTYYYGPYSGGIRFALASLIVIFPISLILFSVVKKGIAREPEKLGLALRKWVLWITIFITGAALAGDLIAVLSGFLGGELTMRFILKALAVFAVSASVFWYAVLEIRLTSEKPISLRTPFIVGSLIGVIAAIMWGFFVMGSPFTVRKLRMDERRVSDLQSIQWQVVNYWQQKSRFPKSLSELEDPLSGYKVPTDPETAKSYEFTLGTGYAFTLCADFTLPNGTQSRSKTKPYPMPMSDEGLAENWEHTAGRACFERVLDPERYPPYAKTR
ncbi:MAG: hypothetical protein G01um101417_376 [Parcubacteria group bacterium Gr01-1014_17]|nr:MAG: hypothetical protein G01um101417_376 [Parcubacteria group bacterium Gr01-1014_17]